MPARQGEPIEIKKSAALAVFVRSRPGARPGPRTAPREGGLRLLAGTGGTLIIVDEKKGGVDPAELCRRCGIEPAELAANDINGLEAALRAVPGAEGARVIIVRGECALLNMGGAVRTYETDVNRCRRCGACSKLGCPAISGRSPVINAEKCVGCGMCASVCKCSAIRERA